MLLNVPSAPFLIDVEEVPDPGRDFLNLETLNSAMFDEFFTGFNNTVRWVRPFSLLSWITWKFPQLHDGDLNADEFRAWSQKIEVLFTASHVLSGNGEGVVGSGRAIPPGDLIELTFQAAKRSSATYWNATQYAPSAKDRIGMGFLFVVTDSSGLYKTTDIGSQLAEAFDRELREILPAARYDFLENSDVSITPNLASKYYEAWNLKNPSPAERQIVSRAFYDATQAGKTTSIGLRSAAMAFVLATLESAQGKKDAASPAMLRVQMSCGPCPPPPQGIAPQVIATARRRIQAQQLRQAERLALESFLSVTEHILYEHGFASVKGIVAKIEEALTDTGCGSDFVDQQMNRYESLAPDCDQLFQLAFELPECNLIEKALTLQGMVSGSSDGFWESEAPRLAIDLLCHVAVLTKYMIAADEQNASRLKSEDSDRLPPTWLVAFTEEWRMRPLSSFLRELIEAHILSRQFSVAAARMKPGQNRTRFVTEDRGIRRASPTLRPLRPGLTGDRIENVLHFASELGMLQRVPPRPSLLAELPDNLKIESTGDWYKLA